MTETLSLPLIIRALGRGKKGTRDLSREEARFTMQSILNGSITQPQLGAFLMLMRVKEETPEEIAGMVEACHEALDYQPSEQSIDINWPAYAGKKKQPSWYLLAAKLLADNGVRILIHGGGEHTPGRQYAQQVCRALNIGVVASLADAETEIQRSNIAYISIANVLPVVSDLIDMKAELGLRSPVNTLVRHLNPLQATVTLQGMFHPTYMPLHDKAAAELKQNCNIVLKGDGGEFEVRPDSETRVAILAETPVAGDRLAPVMKTRAVRPESVELSPLLELWREETPNPYGEAAAIETASLVLAQLHSITLEDARNKVQGWWSERNLTSQ